MVPHVANSYTSDLSRRKTLFIKHKVQNRGESEIYLLQFLNHDRHTKEIRQYTRL
jgi:hypothetical protein